jgi:hypothetical protein
MSLACIFWFLFHAVVLIKWRDLFHNVYFLVEKRILYDYSLVITSYVFTGVALALPHLVFLSLFVKYDGYFILRYIPCHIPKVYPWRGLLDLLAFSVDLVLKIPLPSLWIILVIFVLYLFLC